MPTFTTANQEMNWYVSATTTNIYTTTWLVQYQFPVNAGNAATAQLTYTQGTWWSAGVNGWPTVQGGIIQAPAIMSARTRRRLREEQRRYDDEMARATAERRAIEENARAKARTLLMSTLTMHQRLSLERKHYFDLNVGGRIYRIHQGTHGNVRLVQGGREIRSFCAQPDGVPIEDAMLAQKLMLEADEPAFLRVANARELRAA